MNEGTEPECLSCGSWCFSTRPDYVSVRGSDHARLGELAESLTEFIGNRCYMRMHEGHCAALQLELHTRRFVCSIYEQRPAVCRELLRASPACAAELHEKG